MSPNDHKWITKYLLEIEFMPKESNSAIVRGILSADLNLTADRVIEQAKAKGVKGTPQTLRQLIYNVKSELKKKATPSTVASAARQIPRPQRRPAAPIVNTSPAAVQASFQKTTAAPAGLAGVFANVALVNKVVGLCGGPENARQVADAARTCGGLEAFVQHLDLVAGIRAGDGSK